MRTVGGTYAVIVPLLNVQVEPLAKISDGW